MALSQEVVASLPTKLPLMGDILAPVSLALITEYDEEYLGIITEDDRVQLPKPPVQTAPPAADSACGSCGQTPGSSACDTCGSSTTWVLPGPDGTPGDKED